MVRVALSLICHKNEYLPKTAAYAANFALALFFSLSCSSGDGGGTVNINGQIWMAKNLNNAVAGSKCGGADGSLKDKNTENCDKYGRLYDWAAAMGLPSKCNGVLSASDADCAVNAPHHRGICPASYHIPTNAEWDKLYAYNGPAAGKHLKARGGWRDCGHSGSGKNNSCEDTHGFAALPGGYGYSGGNFFTVGNIGYWWSASESGASYAYSRYMSYNRDAAGRYNGSKGSYLFSVRCLKD